MSDVTAEVIDQRVLERFALAFGDRRPVRDALDGWLEALPSRLETIRDAVTSGTDVRFAALRLESASAALGLTAVAAACRAVGEPAGTNAQSKLTELLDRLDEAQAATRRAIGPWQ